MLSAVECCVGMRKATFEDAIRVVGLYQSRNLTGDNYTKMMLLNITDLEEARLSQTLDPQRQKIEGLRGLANELPDISALHQCIREARWTRREPNAKTALGFQLKYDQKAPALLDPSVLDGITCIA